IIISANRAVTWRFFLLQLAEQVERPEIQSCDLVRILSRGLILVSILLCQTRYHEYAVSCSK
ncbi:hypothetical protein L1D50_16405, partial [Pseudoalteromonas sp. Isolate6]|uniref:hypothetical protein n=1 Tax=Pseudoalteromonas sp. Isolate6 TaxID=2908527 RepID=UPI001EFEDFE9